MPCAKLGNRCGMQLGQLGVHRSHRPVIAEHAAQPLAEIVRIRHGQRRPDGDERLAIALDSGDIDAVERGAAHQAQRRDPFCVR